MSEINQLKIIVSTFLDVTDTCVYTSLSSVSCDARRLKGKPIHPRINLIICMNYEVVNILIFILAGRKDGKKDGNVLLN